MIIIYIRASFTVSLFKRQNNVPLCKCTFALFIFQLRNISVVSIFCLLWKTAVNIVEQVSLCKDGVSFGYMFTNGITGYWVKLNLNFLGKHHIDFQSGCKSLHSHQQLKSVPFALHPRQYKLPVMFLILVILTGIRCTLKVILICIYMMSKGVGHFFKCFIHLRFLCWEFSV